MVVKIGSGLLGTEFDNAVIDPWIVKLNKFILSLIRIKSACTDDTDKTISSGITTRMVLAAIVSGLCLRHLFLQNQPRRLSVAGPRQVAFYQEYSPGQQ
jgi:hypothetical protein